MENELFIVALMLALVYGMFHAFDADHIMAVTGLNGAPGKNNPTQLCFSWAMGHGAVLLLAAVVTYFLGVVIPPEFSLAAEYLVGMLLIIIGAVVIKDIVQMKLHLHFHQHDGMPEHAHWHKHSHSAKQEKNLKHSHDHRALFVGVIHGAAGSAPLLALMPVAESHSAWWSLAYIAIFVSGILFAMLLFGGALGLVMRRLVSYGDYFVRIVRALAATGSLLMGVFILRSLMTGSVS